MQRPQAVLGQAEGSPPAPPDVDSWRRQDYLNRLGIQKNRTCASFTNVPTTHHEAPGQLENTASGSSERSLIDKSTASEENEDGSDMQMKYLDLKSKGDFRVSFLRKLSYEKVWVPAAQRPPKHQTVIIFDWDDTLLCSSFLMQCEGQPLHAVVEGYLRNIQSAAKRLLELALRLGHTFIITNAQDGWVEYSAAKYLPDLLPVLRKVRIVSARSTYEVLYPGEVCQWKINAFLDVQRQLDSQVITNLNALGDSNYEIDATHIMGKQFAQALIKTIKFRENPSPEELMKQLELVAQKFEVIVGNARNLKIGLERKYSIL